MYTTEQLKSQLSKKGYYQSTSEIKDFLKALRIEAIYEDEKGEEYYDEYAMSKLEERFIEKTAIINTTASAPESKQVFEGANLTKVNLDITNQTLAVIADSIATKVTQEITEHLKNHDFMDAAMDAGSKKRDNEILAKQVEKLIEENTRLISKVNTLQKDLEGYKPIFGNFYIKQ